jgi:hypothetical protein
VKTTEEEGMPEASLKISKSKFLAAEKQLLHSYHLASAEKLSSRKNRPIFHLE